VFWQVEFDMRYKINYNRDKSNTLIKGFFMPTAADIYFQKEHILQHKFNAPALLAEQAVYCLELVSELSDYEFTFRFKGGNSLLVVLDTPKRFSIDVDIATGETKDSVKEAVNGIIEKYGVFTRTDIREHKTKPWLPMISFYLYYKSHFAKSGENSIMFDVVLKKSPYPGQMLPVACGDLYKSEIQAELPAISGLIADKMLTLGPHTLGIPLGKGKEGQRLKHYNDVARLLQKAPELSVIRESILACLEQENELQKTPCSIEAVFKDTIETCMLSVKNLQAPAVTNTETALDELVRGITPFAQHLFSGVYSWELLQKDMAACAFCFAAIQNTSVTQQDFDDALRKISDNTQFENDEKSLPGLAEINQNAAHYWNYTNKWL
jgi:hypothetical protein